MITHVSQFDFYLACDTCTSKLSTSKWCEKCQTTRSGTQRLFVSILLDDGLGALKLTFFGKDAERLLGLDAKDVERFSKMNVVELTDNKEFAWNIARIHGKGLDVIMNVSRNEITDLLEGSCIQFKFL